MSALSAIMFKLGVDSSQLDTGLKQAQSKAQSAASGMASSFGGLGGAISSLGLTAGIKQIISEFARVRDLAERFGTSVTSIQKISFAAEQSGESSESLMKALTKLTIEAGKGDETFAKLGISAAAFANASPEQQMVMLADAFSKAEAQGGNASTMFDLLGREAADLVPLLKNGREEFIKLMNQAPVAAESTVKALARADDAIQKGMQQLKVWGAQAMNALIVNPAEILGRWSAGDFRNNNEVSQEEDAQAAAEAEKQRKKQQAAQEAAMQAEEEKAAKEHADKLAEIKRDIMDEDEKYSDLQVRLAEEREKLDKATTNEQRRQSELRIAQMEAESLAIEKRWNAEREAADEKQQQKNEKVDADAAKNKDELVKGVADLTEMSQSERSDARRAQRRRARTERRAERKIRGDEQTLRNDNPQRLGETDGSYQERLDRARKAREDHFRKKVEDVKGPQKSLEDIYEVLNKRLPKEAA